MAKTIFKIFIYNWANNYNAGTGNYTLVDDETEALSIPVNSVDDIWLMAPIVKAEVNKAESFDFSLDAGSKYYNAFIPLKTWIRVVYDTATIFWGHVKTINNSNIIQKRSIHAEGVYSVLNDTPVEGLEEDFQPNLTMRQYFESLISNHNNYAEDQIKKFSIGNIEVSLNSDSKKRSSTSWSTTVNELDKLIEETGGYVRARYNDNWRNKTAERNYLDWSQLYFRDLGPNRRPVIKLSKNLIDISKGLENNEIFTRVIPIGHKSVTTNKKESAFVYLYGTKYIKIKDVPSMGVSVDNGFRTASDFTEAENRYGIIYKTVNFQNAATSSQLQEYCLDWIKNNYYGIVNNFSIKAIDMHMLGDSESQILVGDVVDVTYPEFDNDGTSHLITRKLICKAVQYNLLQPQNNTYTFGVPCDAVDFEYGTKSKTKAKSTAKAATAASQEKISSGGSVPKAVINWETIRNWLMYYYDTILDEDVVNWTETRWVDWGTGVVRTDASGNKRTYYPNKTTCTDPLPYDSCDNNKEFCFIDQIEDGEDETGNKQYVTEKRYIYASFSPPNSSSKIKARIMGHYSINKTKVKKKLYGSCYDYGFCLTDDGHVYTFNWDYFYGIYRRGLLENYTIGTYFEIARVSDGKMTAVEAHVAATNGEQAIPKMKKETTWQNYPLIDPETGLQQIDPETGEPIFMTTAQIGSSEGWSAFGFIKGDNGRAVPGIILWGQDGGTYTDANGETHDIPPGAVTAQDLNLPEIPSFTTKIAAIDNAIIERAVIGELRAAVTALGGEYGDDSYIKDENGNFVKDENGNYILKEGTSFFTNSKNILSASGTYYVNEYYDENGELQRDLVIKDGSGFKQNRNGIEYGVYDEGTLTAGVISRKINDSNETETLINGNRIFIGNGSTKQILSTAAEKYGQVVGTYVWDSKGNLLGLDGTGNLIWDGKAAYGVWHDGNLDGGIIVEKINDGTGKLQTKIKGDIIAIGDKNSKVSLTDAIEINSSGLLQAKNSMYVKGNLYVTSNGNSPGTLSANNVSIGIGGQLSFAYRSGSTGGSRALDATTVGSLLDDGLSHVKITGPDDNDQYTLWYLPVSLSYGGPNDSYWKKCQSFSSTPTLVGSWDGGSGTDPAYFYVKSKRTGKIYYKMNIGGSSSGYNAYLDIKNLGTEENYYASSTKELKVKVGLVAGTPSGLNDIPSYDYERYRKYIYVKAQPAWNAGWDDACKKVSIPNVNLNSASILFGYPTSNDVAGVRVRGDSSITLQMHNDDAFSNNDYVYLGTPGSSTSSFRDYAKFKHGKFTDGRNYEKSVIYTRFGYFSSVGYYIYPYEDTANPHDPSLPYGRLVYKLGQNEDGNKIQIQDSKGNKVNNTPEFTISIAGFDLDNDNKQYQTGFGEDATYKPSARYIRAITNTGVVKSARVAMTRPTTVWSDDDKMEVYVTLQGGLYGVQKVIGLTLDASTIRNRVTLNDPTWNEVSSLTSSRRLTVKASNGKTKSKWIGIDQGSWDTNEKSNDFNKMTVDILEDSWSGDAIARVVVDANARYNAGQDSVTLNDPTWNEVSQLGTTRTLTVKASNGKTKSKWIGIDQGSWDSDNYMDVYVREDSWSGDIIAKTTISGQSIFYDGWKYCANNKVYVSMPKTKTLDYNESVSVSTYWVTPDGNIRYLGAATYTAPGDNSGGGSYANEAVFECRVVTSGSTDTVHLIRTYSYHQAPFTNGLNYTIAW